MSDLTDFLLARIAEDEERATWHHRLLCLRTACDNDGCIWDDDEAMERERVCTCGYPARVLAECEAKRRTIEFVRARAWEYGAGEDMDFDRVLELLAMPYADHPDYREEWKP